MTSRMAPSNSEPDTFERLRRTVDRLVAQYPRVDVDAEDGYDHAIAEQAIEYEAQERRSTFIVILGGDR